MTPDEQKAQEDQEIREAQAHLDQRRRDLAQEREQNNRGFEPVGDIIKSIIPSISKREGMHPAKKTPNPEADNIPKNSGKSPSFQFYQNDWLSDMELQSCSYAAIGLFINMMCHMRNSKRPGWLLINAIKPSKNQLYRVLHIHHKTFKKLSYELIEVGVLKEKNGIYYCSRMLKDEKLRRQNRERQRRKRERNE